MKLDFTVVFILCVHPLPIRGSFNCFESNGRILNNAPKQWFNYVKTVLFLFYKKQELQKETHFKMTIPRVLRPFALLSKSFVRYASFIKTEQDMKNNINAAKERFDMACADTSNPEYWIVFHQDVTTASSQYDVFQMYRPELNLVIALNRNTHIRYRWTFFLHPILHVCIKFW